MAPGSVLVMDNATIHNSEELVGLLLQHGVYVLYLPPYSPWFNPIEKVFSKVKAVLPTLALCHPRWSHWQLIDAAFGLVTAGDCAAFATYCGYS